MPAVLLEPASAQNPPLSSTPVELVRQAVANEVAASNNNSVRHMFHSRKEGAHGTQTRLYVETRDAMVGMTVAYNDQPLNPDQMRGEEERLQHLLDSPEQLQRKRAQEKEDIERTQRILKALPDAFLYESDGTLDGVPGQGKTGDHLVRLKFHPNPRYSPPSRVEMILTAMQGVVLVDRECMRIAKIDGFLFKDIPFGWGILGHLDKGGTFIVQQAALDDGNWEISHMHLRFTGKILLVKSLNITSDEVFSDFRPVPSDLTFAKGVEMLKQEVAKMSRDRTSEAFNKNSH